MSELTYVIFAVVTQFQEEKDGRELPSLPLPSVAMRFDAERTW